MPATFRGSAYLIGMGTKTLSVSTASFEKVFAALAAKQPHTRRQGDTLTDWREIAWAALDRKQLGDTLRRAIEALSVQYREVLFVRDVKNLNTAETAWVLGISVRAARSRLRKARMQVRDALASGLLPKPSDRHSGRCNSRAHGIPCDFRILTLQHSFSLA
jgi:sigma-70-like protein